MGRIGKQKRQLIEEANKRLLGENVVDVDKVLKDMKFKFGYGDLSSMWMEEFEDHMGVDLIKQLDTNEYTDLFADWMRSKAMGYDYEDLPYDDSDVYTLNEQEENEFCKKFPNSVYGEGESSDLGMSKDKALFNAKVNLSKKLNKESISTKILEEKTFMRGSNYVTKMCVEEDV